MPPCEESAVSQSAQQQSPPGIGCAVAIAPRIVVTGGEPIR